MRYVDGTVADVSDPAKEPNDRVHLGVVALVAAMQGHEGVEDDNVDFIVQDGLGDFLNEWAVDLQVAVAVGDFEGHFGPAGEEQPPLQLLLRDSIVLTDGEHATIKLLAAVVSI